jgi:YD repeat-containing protein
VKKNGTAQSTYAYDLSGNEISLTQNSVTTQYGYDAANQLTQVQTGGLTVASCKYDAEVSVHKKLRKRMLQTTYMTDWIYYVQQMVPVLL